jgi:hypothetical protein
VSVHQALGFIQGERQVRSAHLFDLPFQSPPVQRHGWI